MGGRNSETAITERDNCPQCLSIAETELSDRKKKRVVGKKGRRTDEENKRSRLEAEGTSKMRFIKANERRKGSTGLTWRGTELRRCTDAIKRDTKLPKD